MQKVCATLKDLLHTEIKINCYFSREKSCIQ